MGTQRFVQGLRLPNYDPDTANLQSAIVRFPCQCPVLLNHRLVLPCVSSACPLTELSTPRLTADLQLAFVRSPYRMVIRPLVPPQISESVIIINKRIYVLEVCPSAPHGGCSED